MPLQKQIVPLNVSVSANQKTDPQTLTPGTLTTLENARFSKGNRIDKRHGYQVLPNTYVNEHNYRLMLNASGSFHWITAAEGPDQLRAMRFRAKATGTLKRISMKAFYYAGFVSPVNIACSIWSSTGNNLFPSTKLFDGTEKPYFDFDDTSGQQVSKTDWEFPLSTELTEGQYYWFVFNKASGSGGDLEFHLQCKQTNPNLEVDMYARSSADGGNDWNEPIKIGNPDQISTHMVVQINETIKDAKHLTASQNNMLLWADDKILSYSANENIWDYKKDFYSCATSLIPVDETQKVNVLYDSTFANGLIYTVGASFGGGTNLLYFLTVSDLEGNILVNKMVRQISAMPFRLITVNDNAFLICARFNLFVHRLGPQFEDYIDSKVLLSERNELQNSSASSSFASLQTFDVYNWKDQRMIIAYYSVNTVRIKYVGLDGQELTAPYDMVISNPNLTISGQNSLVIIPSSSGDRFFIVVVPLNVTSTDFYIMTIHEDGSILQNLTTRNFPAPFTYVGSGLNNDPQGINGYAGVWNGKDGVFIWKTTENIAFEGKGACQAHIGDDGVVVGNNSGISTANGYPFTNDLVPVSNFVFYNDIPLAIWHRQIENDSSFLLAAIIERRVQVISQVLYGRAPGDDDSIPGLNNRNQFYSNLYETSPGVFRMVLASKDGGTNQTGLVSAIFDFNSKEQFNSVPYGKSMLISGSVLSAYDGNIYRETGFFHRPRAPITRVSGNGSAPTSPGTYSVVFVFEYTDKNGLLHRSAPSDPTSQVVAASQDLYVRYSSYKLSTIARDVFQASFLNDANSVDNPNVGQPAYDDVRVILYRTVANGDIYYREDSTLQTTYGSNPDQTYNFYDLESPEFDYRVGYTDAQLSEQETLYTDSGEIPPAPVGSVKYITQWNNRIWLGGTDLDESILYSKLNQTNLMPEFSENFSIGIQDIPSETTGIGGLSDKLILSKRDRLYYTYGQGPDNLGGGGDFALMEEVLTTSGAVNGRSMVLNQEGLHYMSNKGGIYTLNGSLQAGYTGAVFEDVLEDATIIKGLSSIDSEALRFVYDNGILEKDMYFGTWSRQVGLVPLDAALYNDTFVLLANDNKVYAENRTIFKDDQTAYAMKMETGWISLAGVVGFQRFYRLFFKATYKSPHILRISLAYDYGDYVDQVDIDPAAAIDDDVYRFEVYPTIQKCEAFRFKIEEIITDITPGTQESLELNFIGVVVGTKKGLPKVKQAQKVGVSSI